MLVNIAELMLMLCQLTVVMFLVVWSHGNWSCNVIVFTHRSWTSTSWRRRLLYRL